MQQIREPLQITVFLSPEDPRLTDFEQNILKKLRRSLPRLKVVYAANSRTGLFENADDHYGEIWYEMGGRKVMERSTIDEVVLEQIYSLAGVSPPERTDVDEFPGYPLAVQPRHASLIFYLIWPLTTILAWWLVRK
jgi:ABC-2 type transport system permease protein